ncbi:hypothetical protein QBC35DRAFT_206285 [Podospora australis]|uniref:Rhodopsin domain-containing protein n=1 Tax=Podospora australis TaxID=1536484 RepID=A0AAN6WU02_9PEZI|nr:hypothetical protein QBC35DRAFT_206285 [Podospora australis]
MLLEIDPRGTRLFVLQITFLVLVWCFVSLRALVKFLTIKKITLDDWLMLAAVLVYTAHATITIWGIVYASQKGKTDYYKSESIALHSWFLNEAIYAPLSALVRSSIAVFLLRIATAKLHRWIIYGNLVCVWLLTIVYFFIVIFQCSPSSYFYEQVLDPSAGVCVDNDIVPQVTIAHSVTSALTDFILAFLPIAILWHVKLNKRTKAGVATLLSMGFLAGICLIVRIPHVKFIPVSSPDFLEQTTGTAFWSIMETSLGIIAGCAATMRPMMRGFGPNKDSWQVASSFTKSNEARRAECEQSQHLREIKDDFPLPYPPSSPADIDGGTIIPQETDSDISIALHRPEPTHPGLGCSSSASKVWGWRRTPSSGSTFLLHSGGVKIKTSIEITRQTQSETGRGTPTVSFPLRGGQQVVRINGPLSRCRSSLH